MKKIQTNNSVKFPVAALYYMLNVQPEKSFIVSFNGEKHKFISRDNKLIKLKINNRKQIALKVTSSKGEKYFFGPFRVISFPDEGHILSFKCENAVSAETIKNNLKSDSDNV